MFVFRQVSIATNLSLNRNISCYFPWARLKSQPVLSLSRRLSLPLVFGMQLLMQSKDRPVSLPSCWDDFPAPEYQRIVAVAFGENTNTRLAYRTCAILFLADPSISHLVVPRPVTNSFCTSSTLLRILDPTT